MKYNVTIKKSAIKVLEKINEPDYSKIKQAVYSLADNPRPFGYEKLKGRPGYRIRQGNFRIIYEIYNNILIVDVIAIGHRRDIYE